MMETLPDTSSAQSMSIPKKQNRGWRLTVLQNAPIGQINPASLVGDDDDRSTEGDIPAEPHLAGDGEMVELEDVGHGAEALLEVANLLERVAELDHGRLVEHPVRVHDELAVLKAVEIRGDQEQVGCGLDLREEKIDVLGYDRQSARGRGRGRAGDRTYGQEPRTGHIDTMCALEVLDGRTNRSLELNDRRAVVRRLVVDDDIELHALVLHDSLDGGEGDIHRVGVEVLEFAHTLKVLDVLARHLGDFEQAHLALVLDDGTTLNVCLGLVREFHKEFGFRADEVGKDPEIYIGAQVVDIGHKDVLLASGNELVQKA